MYLNELINDDLPPLRDTDSVDKAMAWMDEFKVSHLPVIDSNRKLLGLVTEDDLMDAENPDSSIAAANFRYNMAFLNQNNHLLDVINIFAETNTTVVPIIDDKEAYQGCISYISAIKELGKISFFKDRGGIISLQLNLHDYTLTQIANIVEQNGARVMGSYVRTFGDSTKIEVTIKINRYEIRDVLQTFERYDYVVTSYFDNSEYEESLRDRYDQFMNYLNT